MSEQRTAKNLRLEDDEGESATYIRLEETGQDLADRWRLQAGETPSDWQPVEYDRPSRGGVGWILPLLIGAIVVGVAVPLLYFGVNSLLNSELASSIGGDPSVAADPNVAGGNGGQAEETGNTGEGNEVAEPAVVLQPTDAPEEEPAAEAAGESAQESTADAEPTPVLIEEEVAIINSQYGVNARLEPSTTADVLRILEQNEEVTILDRLSDEENGIEWLQVLTSEDAEVWLSADFVDISTRLVAEDTGEVVEAVSEDPEAVDPEAVDPEATDPEAETLEPAVDAEAVPAASDVSVRVTISSPAGLNARSSPSPDSTVITILEDGQTVTAIQRSDDGQWVQVELDDDETGWIFLSLVIPTDDLSALPSISEVAASQAAADAAAAEESATEEATATEEAAGDGGEATTPSEDAADAPAEGGEAADDAGAGASESASSEIVPVFVASQYGVNARSTTSTEGEVLQIVDGGTELSAIGRSEDSTWLQAPLEDGTLAWIFAEALTVTEAIDTLPVVTPPAVGDPAETLPEPLSAPETASDDATTDEEPAADEEDADAATDEASDIQTSGGITSTVPITLTAAVTATDGVTTTAAVTTTESITGTSGVTSTIDSSALVTSTEAVTSTESVASGASDGGATATVVSLIDAKARPIPSAGEDSIQEVPNGVVLIAIGRSANNFWVQVELPDGRPAWVFANNVSLSVDISELPEVTPEQ